MSKGHKRIFLSYARGDRDLASRLGDLLKKRGASVFVDSNVRPGNVWADVLRAEIEKATALVLLVPSQNVLGRNSVWFEAGAAKALGKTVLAILPPHHEASRTELPTDIADILVLDAEDRTLENIADILIQAVPEENNRAMPTT